jgi:hypothetical protein
MTEPERCPRCNETAVVAGTTYSQGGCVAGFVPHNARQFWGPGAVAVAERFQACLSCGHLWSHLAPAKLRQFLQNHTGEIGRQYLDEIERGPYRDLPDTELARMIGEHVAEIDALVRSGDTSKAVRRYRGLRGVIWDQAIKDVDAWANLTRPEKLALFGRIPKKAKAPFDDLL